MSTKRYFQILGIPPTKNENLIKKAYRKKAMKYHPDRNPSKAAKDKFIQVTEAYDQILLALEQAEKLKNVSPRQTNTTQEQRTRRTHARPKTNNSQRSKTNSERDERVKEAQQRYEQMKRKEALEDERYFQSISTGKKWKRFKIVMLACTTLCLLITLDSLYLPTHTTATKIISKNIRNNYVGTNYDKTSPVVFDNGQKAWIALEFVAMEERNYMFLERTPIFKDIKYVKIFKNNHWLYYTPDYSLISTFPLIPFVLLLPLITYFIKGRTIYFSILYNMSMMFMPIFLVVLLISNDRWAHLLTLGLLG